MTNDLPQKPRCNLIIRIVILMTSYAPISSKVKLSVHVYSNICNSSYTDI